MMDSEYDFSQGKRGAVDPVPPGKTRITIRLDDDILAWFRASVDEKGGGNYQTLITATIYSTKTRTIRGNIAPSFTRITHAKIILNY